MPDDIMTTKPLSITNLADGAIARSFDEVVAEILENFTDTEVVGTKASFTIKVDVTRMGEADSNQFYFTAHRPTVKWPAKKASAKIVRVEGGIPTVDVLEQASGDRQLPFPHVVNKSE